MKILYIVPRFPAASETFIAEEIIGVRERGHNVTVAALVRPSNGQIEAMGERLQSLVNETIYLPRVPIVVSIIAMAFRKSVRELNRRLSFDSTMESRASLRLLRACAIASLANKVGAELIYSHWPRPTEVALLAGEISGLPVGVSIHAHEVAHDNGHFLATFEKIEFAAFCNNAAKKYLLDKLPLSSNAKASLIYHGVDLSQFEETNPLPVSEDLHVVTAGRLTPTKGIDRLIRALGIAKDRGLNISLTVVGDGSQRVYLEDLTSNLGLCNQVRFVGWVPHEEMSKYLSDAHVFALLADVTFHDGLPNVVLESMALGRPAILSPLPAAAEAVEHEKNGYILSHVDSLDEFVDCCASLLEQPYQLNNWSSQAAKTAREKHDRAHQLDKLCDLFTEAVKCQSTKCN